MKMYEIDARIERLLTLESGNAVDTETGELFTKEMVDELFMERHKKIENCVLFVKNMNYEAKMLKEEIEVLTARMKACKAKAERATEYVKYVLAGDKFKTPRCEVSYIRSKVVEIADNVNVRDLDDRFLRTKYTIEADKVELKKAIEAGEEIDGVTIVEKQNIKIK